jgi:TPR repeat protein
MKWAIIPALALSASSLLACGEGFRLGAETQSPAALPYHAHALTPTKDEYASKPCKFGDVARCIEQCQTGDAHACNAMGVIFEYGRQGTPDSAIASGFYSRACDTNYAPACTNLAWLYSLGHGVPRDANQAMLLFTRAFDSSRLACRRGDGHGCMMAGELLLLGKVEAKEDDSALAMFQLACAQGESEGCAYVEQLGQGQSPAVERSESSASD